MENTTQITKKTDLFESVKTKRLDYICNCKHFIKILNRKKTPYKHIIFLNETFLEIDIHMLD